MGIACKIDPIDEVVCDDMRAIVELIVRCVASDMCMVKHMALTSQRERKCFRAGTFVETLKDDFVFTKRGARRNAQQ